MLHRLLSFEPLSFSVAGMAGSIVLAVMEPSPVMYALVGGTAVLMLVNTIVVVVNLPKWIRSLAETSAHQIEAATQLRASVGESIRASEATRKAMEKLLDKMASVNCRFADSDVLKIDGLHLRKEETA